MILKELLASTPVFEIVGLKSIDINGISLKPQDVKKGYLYIYSPETAQIPYEKAVKMAAENGAVAVCIGRDQEILEIPLTYIKTYHYDKFLSAVARNFYNNPSQALQLVGITGSHGKTTIGSMIESILELTNISGVMLKTHYCHMEDVSSCSYDINPLIINSFLSKTVKEGIEWAIIECNYTSILKERFRHIWFDSIIYTDLYTYFKNRKADCHYIEIRKTLLDHLKAVTSPIIVNMDDYYSTQLLRSSTVGYGIYNKFDVNANKIDLMPDGSSFILITPKGKRQIRLNVPGIHNVYNALATAAWALSEGLDLGSIVQGLEVFRDTACFNEETCIKGKVSLYTENQFKPDGLEAIYKDLRNQSKPKDGLVTILCIGDCRDEGEYKAIADIVGEYSTYCITTSDYFCSKDSMSTAIFIAQRLKDIPVSHEADHYKALQKAVMKVKDGGYILILARSAYEG